MLEENDRLIDTTLTTVIGRLGDTLAETAWMDNGGINRIKGELWP